MLSRIGGWIKIGFVAFAGVFALLGWLLFRLIGLLMPVALMVLMFTAFWKLHKGNQQEFSSYILLVILGMLFLLDDKLDKAMGKASKLDRGANKITGVMDRLAGTEKREEKPAGHECCCKGKGIIQ